MRRCVDGERRAASVSRYSLFLLISERTRGGRTECRRRSRSAVALSERADQLVRIGAFIREEKSARWLFRSGEQHERSGDIARVDGGDGSFGMCRRNTARSGQQQRRSADLPIERTEARSRTHREYFEAMFFLDALLQVPLERVVRAPLRARLEDIVFGGSGCFVWSDGGGTGDEDHSSHSDPSRCVEH